MFLTEQFRLLQQRLEDAIPTAKKAFLQQFYSQVGNNSILKLNLLIDFCLSGLLDLKEICS